jgi:hypothetical protein
MSTPPMTRQQARYCRVLSHSIRKSALFAATPLHQEAACLSYRKVTKWARKFCLLPLMDDPAKFPFPGKWCGYPNRCAWGRTQGIVVRLLPASGKAAHNRLSLLGGR